jgi:sugar/nucleoside kinase (ribokinase family)
MLLAELWDVDLLHLSGYWLFSGLELDVLASRKRTFHELCCLTVDLGSVSRIRSLGPCNVRRLLALLQPDVIFANHNEAEETQLLNLPPTDGLLVVTSGPDPTKLLFRGEILEVDVPPVKNIVDTTGSGDAFVAGFLAAALGGAGAEAATTVGHASARRVVQAAGAG